MKRFVPVLFCFFVLSSCSLAPKYNRPDIAITENYKEAGIWIPATPSYANTDRGPWWQIYDDATLNQLEERVTLANQNLAAAVSRYQEAKALAGVARADLFPTITAVGDYDRIKTSATLRNPQTIRQYNDMQVGANLSYEIDVWGTRSQSSCSSL